MRLNELELLNPWAAVQPELHNELLDVDQPPFPSVGIVARCEVNHEHTAVRIQQRPVLEQEVRERAVLRFGIEPNHV